jgi:hypothetical protein
VTVEDAQPVVHVQQPGLADDVELRLLPHEDVQFLPVGRHLDLVLLPHLLQLLSEHPHKHTSPDGLIPEIHDKLVRTISRALQVELGSFLRLLTAAFLLSIGLQRPLVLKLILLVLLHEGNLKSEMLDVRLLKDRHQSSARMLAVDEIGVGEVLLPKL